MSEEPITTEEPKTEEIVEKESKWTYINLLLLVLVAAMGAQVGISIGGDYLLMLLPNLPEPSLEMFIALFAMFMIAWGSREYFIRN